MSLRLRLNLAIALLSLAFIGVMAALQVEATRRSVREEIDASHRIATQLLVQVDRAYAQGDEQVLLQFLGRLGRVRSNELSLVGDDGRVRYQSPPSPYRVGQQAPAWFDALVSPPLQPREVRIQNATLRIVPIASRAVLDGWDDVRLLLGAGAGFMLLTLAVVAWLVARATAPFERIEKALVELEGGAWGTRVPPVRGREASRIRDAINRVAETLPERMAARAAELAAREQLEASRAFGEQLQSRIEQERAMLARELHDEFGQSVTAIRSLAGAIGRRAGDDATIGDAAALIDDAARRSYAGMQRLIANLRPMALDTLGLGAALEDLVARWQAQPDVPRLALRVEAPLDGLSPAVSLAAFRIVQEALGNAIRHAQASAVTIALLREGQGLRVRIDDDGAGLPSAPPAAGSGNLRGGFGLHSMRERAEVLGGRLAVGAAPGGRGTRIEAWLPDGGSGRHPAGTRHAQQQEEAT
ncbi:sensor histidine kinase [Caldimonas tepidiphila]|uniref:sensor histidine kinase n=1 Tax=Caldimonas tepidiphila TaxID=2315841 RepID=UPI000E5B76C1|nr:ATP-binding protein [Caldimonas tepidiphila]